MSTYSEAVPLSSPSRSEGWKISGLVLFVLYLALWAALPLIMGKGIPDDNQEQLDWAQSAEWGYPKHPPLPTLVLIAFEYIFPESAMLTYALGALQVGLMLVCATSLARWTLGEAVAMTAPVLATCIVQHGGRLHYYNHNTALMAANALAMVCVWKARNDRWIWWVALGCCWGLGMLSKYQMGLVILCNTAFVASVPTMSWPRRIRGILIASVVCAALLVPHVLWLLENNFPTFSYASGSLGAGLTFAARSYDLAKFFVIQVVRCKYLLFLVAALAWIVRDRLKSDVRSSEDAVDPDSKRFWTIHAWGPFLMIAILSSCAGVDLESHWASAFLWTLPIWAFTTGRFQWLLSLRRETLLCGVVLCHLVMILGFAVSRN